MTSSYATYTATFNYEYSFNDVCIDSDASSSTGYQVTSSDGANGTVIFKLGAQTLSVAVKKFTPGASTSSSLVNKLA